jgi:gamma-glutamylcyclotransferase (GGCT)/AIG2-like uncharacterized protein YtfP
MISKRDDILLFVYGTLKSGEENHFRLKKSKFVGISFTKPDYHLFFVDTDSPDIKRDKNDGRIVEGELYMVPNEVIKEIDEYEKPYKRHKIELGDGQKAQAYFYRTKKK